MGRILMRDQWATCVCGHRVLGVVLHGPAGQVIRFECQRCPRAWERPVPRPWRIW